MPMYLWVYGLCFPDANFIKYLSTYLETQDQWFWNFKHVLWTTENIKSWYHDPGDTSTHTAGIYEESFVTVSLIKISHFG